MARLTAADANWDARFGPSVGSSLNGSPGASTIYAVATAGNNVYVGGQFTSINGTAANNLARWDGAAWHDVGGGLDGPVRTILVNGTNVVVGGQFSHAATVRSANVAQWDGMAWHAMGQGISSANASDPTVEVNALASLNGDLYAAGHFDQADGNAATNIARWNGASWEPLIMVYSSFLLFVQTFHTNNGVSGMVNALASDGTNLFVGGSFLQSTGAKIVLPLISQPTYATNLTAWNGAGWTNIGWQARSFFGSAGSVQSLAFDGGHLVAGGSFSSGNGDPFNGVAIWDGSQWSALGGGVQGSVHTLAVAGTNVYAGGFFPSAGGVAANSLALWNGSAWVPVAQSINPNGGPTLVNAIAADVSGNLYAGGLFEQIDSAQVQNIAIRSPDGWSGLGQGLAQNNGVGAGYALVRYQGKLVIGGAFTSAGGVQASNVASWDGSIWSALGGGLNGSVSALAAMSSNLYAAGNFKVPGFPGNNNIAAWDGSKWAPVGGGIEGSVHALTVLGSDLIVGGEFKTAGGMPAQGIAAWNGSSWQNVGPSDALSLAKIYCLATMGGKLYAGGLFAHNAAGNSIAVWDGATWSNLGQGLQSHVFAIAYSLASDGTRLYVGGNFDTAGGVNSPNLAVWDGATWNGLGSTPQGVVFALNYFGGALYAGGDFVDGFGIGAKNVAAWDGQQWSAFGSGIGFPSGSGSFVQAVLADTNEVFVTGNFSIAGGNVSEGIAAYYLRTDARGGLHVPLIRANPASDGISVQLDADAAGYTLEATDAFTATGQPQWATVAPVAGPTNIVISAGSQQQFFRLVQ